MAENKKSFVAYCDWEETFEELSDEEAGKLIKHLFKYVNDKNPETSDKLTKMCFIPIKQSLKRDLKKYEKYIEKQSVNGKKGGRPKNPTLLEITQPLIEEPKKADSVSVSVSDNVSDKDINKQKEKAPVFNFRKELLSLGGKDQLVSDWLIVRNKKKSANTKTALNGFLNQVKLTGKDLNFVLEKCVVSNWSGFKSEWLGNANSFGVKKQNNQLKSDGTFKMS